jgi:tetratricopeptide (TPR) repeat protein
MNEQSLEIVEAHFGEDAIEQLPYLERLAKLKRLQRVCCSTRIMKQALDIVEANPNVDDELKVRTFLEIGDAYTISGNREEAETFYRRAWDLMPAAERIDKFSAPSKIAFSKPLSTAQTSLNTRMYRVERDPFGRRDFKPMLDDEIRELESLPPQEFVLNADNTEYDIRIRDRMLSADPLQKPAVRTVGQPYTFLRKQFLQILPSRLHSDQALEALEVDLEFDIDATGKPFNIKVISEGTPSKVNRLMRDVVRKSRFRPRMEDGYPVATRAFKLTQSFAAKTTITSESI